jgi:hypothetical protein
MKKEQHYITEINMVQKKQKLHMTTMFSTLYLVLSNFLTDFLQVTLGEN